MKFKSISVNPNGVIKPNSNISVECNVPINPKFAQSSIYLKGVDGRVELSNNEKLAIWKPISTIPEGYYTFEIDELIFKDGSKQEASIRIPLLVLNSKARISKDLSVLNFSRIQIEDTDIKRIPLGHTSGNYVELIKAMNKNRQFIDLAYNKQGDKIDANKLFKNYNKKYMEKYGRIHESLYDEINTQKKDKFKVAIWLNIKQNASELGDKKLRESDEDRKLRKDIQDKTKRFAEKISIKFNIEEIKIDEFAPVVYATLSKSQILAIEKDKDVGKMYLVGIKPILSLQDSIDIAQSDQVHITGVNGSNVKVAVWEASPDVWTELSITEVYDSSPEESTNHARLTTAVIKNRQRSGPHGHAPHCIMHSANSHDLSALNWALEKGCTVISQSWHWDYEADDRVLSFYDIYKDYLVLKWPYPTILQAAGNQTGKGYVVTKGYNSLAVGNHNDSANAMSGSSSFKNPKSPHGDRELPEICANGIGVTAVGLSMSGTSFAAPAVAGIAALIQSVDQQLKLWPEGCRAILLAGSKRNVTGDRWYIDNTVGNDARDGSGSANSYESVAIAENRVLKDGLRLRGWDVGTLSSNSFDSTTALSKFSYRVKIPIYAVGAILKVALAWNSKIVTYTFPDYHDLSILSLDLDLMVFDDNDNPVGWSNSLDNSYEIVEISVRQGKTYTIKVQRNSGNDPTWFGIAWTVYGVRDVVSGVPDINSELPNVQTQTP